MGINLRKLHNVTAPILLLGSSGVGKSKLAREIHTQSNQHYKKFLTIHLASLSETLIESELFGHTKGAFTSATNNHQGYLETVQDGTLFLDEVGELSLNSQKKLLLLLEEKIYYPVGSTDKKNFMGRVIIATNKDLKAMVKAGTFREDLFYRLQIFCYKLPHLKEDKSFITKMLDYYLDQFKRTSKKPDLHIDAKCRDYLLNYSWPGNIRELKNCIEYVVTCAEQSLITKDDLPSWLEPASSSRFTKYSLYNDAFEDFEKKYLQEALTKYRGKINLTSREIGVCKSTLISKIKKYGINIIEIKYNHAQKKLPNEQFAC